MSRLFQPVFFTHLNDYIVIQQKPSGNTHKCPSRQLNRMLRLFQPVFFTHWNDYVVIQQKPLGNNFMMYNIIVYMKTAVMLHEFHLDFCAEQPDYAHAESEIAFSVVYAVYFLIFWQETRSSSGFNVQHTLNYQCLHSFPKHTLQIFRSSVHIYLFCVFMIMILWTMIIFKSDCEIGE